MSGPRTAEPPRLDARSKVTGTARFVEDLPGLPGMLYAASIRSPYSHARIRSIDSAAAEALPGVAGILHRDRLEGMDIHRQASSIHQEFLATDKVRFDGDLVGLTAAEDLRTAREAAELVDVDYEPLPVLFSYAEAMAEGAPLVHDELGHNLAVSDSLAWGDVEAGMAAAAHIVQGSWFSPSAYHHPMEPASTFLLRWEAGTVEIWAPVHKLFLVREEVATILGIEPEQVRIHVPYIGGSFGGKDVTSSEIHAAAALSRTIGRPIKFVATEEESFRINARHAMTYRGRMGLSASGEIAALDVELELDTGAYLTGAEVVTNNAVQSAMGGYRVPHLRVRAKTAYTNKVPAATFRSTGRSQTTYALECLIDMAAERVGQDPLAFRLRNIVLRGEALSPATWRRRDREGPTAWTPMDADVDELARRAVAAIDWSGELGQPATAEREPGRGVATQPQAELAQQAGADKPLGHGGLKDARSTPQPGTPEKVRGRGVAISFRRSSNSGDAQAALRLEPDGVIAVLHNAPDLGEGSHHTLAIIASQAVGVPLDGVHIREPDTANELYFTGVSSQRTTVHMGTALTRAATELRDKALQAVARLHETSPDAWRFEDGQLAGPEGARVSLAELAGSAPAGQPIEGRGEYHADVARKTGGPGRDHWTAGAAAVELEVDRATGEVELLRYAAVADAGKVLHWASAKGQVEGGAVLGIGLALHEEMLYQEGQLQNGDPFQYRLPAMRDLPPDFAVAMLEEGDGPGPFGSKAMAQTSVPCVVPAIANAIYDAVGVRLTAAPFTPERVLEALGQLPEADSPEYHVD